MSKNIDNDLDYKQAFNKLLDLFMYNEIEESKMFINIISKEIDFKTQMRNQLLCNKPFKFQKKKTEQYNKELEKLEDEILQCYKSIELELKEISKLQNSISNSDSKTLDNVVKKNSKISFYDLLALIKDKKHPNKIILEMCNKEETYIFDGEANYILEDDKAQNDTFEYYLSDCISDFSKLEKNITILK